MRATKIKMKQGCGTSNNLLEIDSIFLTGASTEKFYQKAFVHDYLVKNPGGIQVNISPYPNLIPLTSPPPLKHYYFHLFNNFSFISRINKTARWQFLFCGGRALR